MVAITTDDALLEQIGQVLDTESIIRPADSPAEALQIASPRQPCVVLLDARGHEDLARVVADLQSPEATRVIVILAPAEASDDVARTLRGSAAYAVVTFPIDPAQAAAVLGGAREESLVRHALLTAVPAAPKSPAPEPAPAAPQDPISAGAAAAFAETRARRAARATAEVEVEAAPRRRPPALLIALVALVALIGGALWYWLQSPGLSQQGQAAAPPVAVAPASDAEVEDLVVPEALQAGSVDELLDAARAAMRARQYTDPEGQNALNYYRSVLAQEPDNGEAREGLERIAAVLHERVRVAVEQRRLDEAQRTLAHLRTIRADDPMIARYEPMVAEARIRRAMDESEFERARELLRQATKSGVLAPEVVARWQSELERQQGAARADQLAELVTLRIRQGRLLEPANDNAKHYLALLRRAPGDVQQRVEVATTELQQAYVARYREALARSQRAEAERWKTEARALGVTAAELAAVQREAGARSSDVADPKQEVVRLTQLVQERISSRRLLEPVGDSAVFHLYALRALDPTAAAPIARTLSVNLMEQGRAALADRRVDVARAHASAARQLGVDLEAVTAFEKDIAAAGSKAAAAAAPAPRFVRTRYVAPEYPPNALRQGLAGKVRVQITIDAKGRVREASVVHAEPPGVFDAAALAAVRRWRFKEIGDEDSGVTATGTLDISFRPEDVNP